MTAEFHNRVTVGLRLTKFTDHRRREEGKTQARLNNGTAQQKGSQVARKTIKSQPATAIGKCETLESMPEHDTRAIWERPGTGTITIISCIGNTSGCRSTSIDTYQGKEMIVLLGREKEQRRFSTAGEEKERTRKTAIPQSGRLGDGYVLGETLGLKKEGARKGQASTRSTGKGGGLGGGEHWGPFP